MLYISIATGSSWTTSATVGIALIGVGGALGFDLGMVAGAVISGYFGDKLSPMSDTTNLAMAGTDLFTHQIYDLNDHSNICYHNDPFHCTRIIS
jgi:NhaC family Na+:H+ antiporter